MLVATKVLAPPLWGWLADKTGKSLALIRISTLLSAMIFASFLFVRDYQSMALITIAFSFFWNAALPQFEAATLLHVRLAPQRYSQIRLWGSIGFILAVLGIGRFLDDFDITLLPSIITSLMSLNWLVAILTPEIVKVNATKSLNSQKNTQSALELGAFFSVYLLLQVAHGPYYAFYSVYLQQHDYTGTQTALFWSLGVCAEIVIFLTMTRLQKYVSLRQLLLGSLILSSVRWLIIAEQIDYLPAVLGAQVLHAASFGITQIVAMQLLQGYFGEQHQSKGQALYSSLSFGLGGMLGSYFSGYFWDLLGGSSVFLAAASLCTLAWLIAFIGVARHNPATLG
ncbi:MAG: hypothetical protein RL563_949 [Pseudomonadota bacterium]